jgi:uncharacterized protein YkwD
MSVRRLLMLLLLVTGMLALPFPASAGPRTDAAFVRATNADRREAGPKSMATSATLARLARSHSVAMARRSASRHGGRRVQNAFMASSGHRRNILYRKANRFGVGTWVKDGVIWVTVNFEPTTPGWG